jgi:hypothetical protein
MAVLSVEGQDAAIEVLSIGGQGAVFAEQKTSIATTT